MNDRVLRAIAASSADASADPLSREDQLHFARAYREHYPVLVSFVRRRVDSDIEAADIAQEAYLRILRYRGRQDLDSPSIRMPAKCCARGCAWWKLKRPRSGHA